MIKKKLKTVLETFSHLKNSIFGNNKYRKFIVITRSRTGSNLLISFLNSHPNINAKGEVFGKLEGRTTSKVWNNIFSFKPKEIMYVGFKIFYYHPIDSDDKSIWDLIKNDESIRIIHLTRLNMLRTVVSRQIAEKTNSWANKKSSIMSTIDKQIELDIDDCLDEFESTLKNQEKVRNEFARIHFMELSYEDLSKNNQETMNQVFDFLDIKSIEVKSGFKKQNSEKISDLVLNYEDLHKRIHKTKFSDLLDLDS